MNGGDAGSTEGQTMQINAGEIETVAAGRTVRDLEILAFAHVEAHEYRAAHLAYMAIASLADIDSRAFVEALDAAAWTADQELLMERIRAAAPAPAELPKVKIAKGIPVEIQRADGSWVTSYGPAPEGASWVRV